MYLHVNPSGHRHTLCAKFSNVISILKTAVDGVEYSFTVLNPNKKGKYDLIVSRVTETVSKKQFIKARFIENPNNTGRFDGHPYELFFPVPVVAKPQKSFDALSLLLDSLLVNGFLPMDPDIIPDSVLDDFDTLNETLDNFFRTAVPTL